MPFTYRTDYQNMQPQEIDPRFQGEKRPGRKGVILALVFAIVFVAILVIVAYLLSTHL